MNEHDPKSLRAPVEDAIALLRRHDPQLRAALAPIVDSLEALCVSLQRSAGHAEAWEGHAAVLVVTRDVIATALRELAGSEVADSRAVTLALATLHNRIVAALDACVVARV